MAILVAQVFVLVRMIVGPLIALKPTLSENEPMHGSWAYLVKRGDLGVLHRFPVSERVRKAAPLPRGSFSISLIEVPALSTSPKLAKSPCTLRTTCKHPVEPTLSENGSLYSCQSGFLGRCFSARVY
jgi:hypothetical protein